MLSGTNQKKNSAFSSIKKRESLVDEINKEKLDADFGPRIETKK